MNEVKTIDCIDIKKEASGAYFGEVPMDEQHLMVGDIAQLSCEVIALVKVQRIDGEEITGNVLGFENSDADSIDGIVPGDDVRFGRNKVHDWHRP